MDGERAVIWPLVVERDDGIRPAGAPDQCFYCGQKIGQPHEADCVIVGKKILIRYSFEIEVEIPHSWTAEDIEAHRNDSSWCANNALDELEANREKHGCLCGVFHATQVRVLDDTPTRHVRPETAAT